MKKIALLLAAAALLSSLAACPPTDAPERDSESEILRLESSAEGASTDASTESDLAETEPGTAHETTGETTPETDGATTPETEPETEPPYTGSLPSDRGFRVEYIRNDGTGSYYAGADPADMTAMFKPYVPASGVSGSHDFVTPYSIILWNGNSGSCFVGVYDKLTGKTELLCTDELCNHEFCMWYQNPSLIYAGREHLYFITRSIGTTNRSLFRTDLNRGNVEYIMELNQYENDYSFSVYHEEDDRIYMTRQIPTGDIYGSESLSGVFSLTTWEFTPIEESRGLHIGAVLDDDTCLWFQTEDYERYKFYRTNHDFSEMERLTELEAILYDPNAEPRHFYQIQNGYAIIGRNGNEHRTYKVDVVYNLKTGEVIQFPELIGEGRPMFDGTFIDGYVYYSRELTEEERTHPSDSVSGRIYRMNLQTFEEECVLALTVDDIPVKIHSFVMEGTICSIAYETWEEYRNRFHPKEDSLLLPEHHLIVDFGTGEILLLDEEVIYD